MKEPSFPSVVEQAFELSPEAAIAQRDAEMAHAHRYRAERMAKYAEWSKPEAVKARYEEYEKAAPAAEVRVIKLPTFTNKVKVTELHKSPAPKPTWFVRLKTKLGLA